MCNSLLLFISVKHVVICGLCLSDLKSGSVEFCLSLGLFWVGGSYLCMFLLIKFILKA